MTSKDSPTAENEALASKVDAVEQELVALRSAIGRGRVTRLLLLTAVLALIGLTIWSFYNLAMDFRSQENLDLLAAKARERIDDSAGPAKREIEALVDHCTPVVTEAFRNQVEKDRQKFADALSQEGDLLVKNLETRLHAQFMDRYQKMEQKYEGILQEEFPEIDDPELIVELYAGTEQILEKLVEKYYSEQLEQEFEKLGTKWEKFEMAEIPAEGDPPLEQQFLANLLQVGAFKLDAKSEL